MQAISGAFGKMTDAEKKAQIKKVRASLSSVATGSVLPLAVAHENETRQPTSGQCTHAPTHPRTPELTVQTNGIFQINIKNPEGKEATWVIDLKEAGNVTKGAGKKAGES